MAPGDECQECRATIRRTCKMHIPPSTVALAKCGTQLLRRSPVIVTRVTESKVEYAVEYTVRERALYPRFCSLSVRMNIIVRRVLAKRAAAATCARCSFPLHFARLVPVSIAKAYVYSCPFSLRSEIKALYTSAW